MTAFEVLLQQLLTGLSNGMIIALVALGYTMVYGIVELINFAHGDLFMLGTFVIYTIVVYALPSKEPPTYLVVLVLAGALIAAVIFCASLNFAIDYTVYRPLRN